MWYYNKNLFVRKNGGVIVCDIILGCLLENKGGVCDFICLYKYVC